MKYTITVDVHNPDLSGWALMAQVGSMLANANVHMSHGRDGSSEDAGVTVIWYQHVNLSEAKAMQGDVHVEGMAGPSVG